MTPVPLQAAILSIGDELTLGQKIDTNSAWLSAELCARSVPAVEHRTVPDERDVIARTMTELAAGHGLLLVTGGLGPTEDDLTRRALADVFTPGEALVTDEAAVDALETWFAGRGRPMSAINLEQAKRPRTMRLLTNPHGTAPGLAGRLNACAVFVMPGPPREMRPMFTAHVVPALPTPPADRQVATGLVQMFGLGESEAAERLGRLTDRGGAVTVGTTASSGIIAARVRSEGAAEVAREGLEETLERIEAAWTPYAFGRGDTTLSAAVGDALRCVDARLVTAESCTGGGIGATIVDTPGSSAYYAGGWITYADAMKTAELGVSPALLREHGAVSPEVAAAMAAGALARGDATHAVAVTGVAGPGGERPDKPAGLVYIALAGAGSPADVRRFRFRGDRGVVRDRTVKSALQMVRLSLTATDRRHPLLWESPV